MLFPQTLQELFAKPWNERTSTVWCCFNESLRWDTTIVANATDNESYTWCSIIAAINLSIIPEDMYITITVVPPFRKRSAAAQLKKWSIPKPLASFPFTCFVLHSSHVLVPTPFILSIHDFKTCCHFGWSTFYRLPLSWAYINPVHAGLWASADWWHQRGVSSRSSSDLWFLLVDSDPDHVPSPFSRVHGLTAKQEMETRLMGVGNKAMIQEPRVKSLMRKDG